MMISQGQPIVGGAGLMNNQGQQMVMMSTNMVRMPQQQGQQYMRMQDQGRMMHNPGNPGRATLFFIFN